MPTRRPSEVRVLLPFLVVVAGLCLTVNLFVVAQQCNPSSFPIAGILQTRQPSADGLIYEATVSNSQMRQTASTLMASAVVQPCAPPGPRRTAMTPGLFSIETATER